MVTALSLAHRWDVLIVFVATGLAALRTFFPEAMRPA